MFRASGLVSDLLAGLGFGLEGPTFFFLFLFFFFLGGGGGLWFGVCMKFPSLPPGYPRSYRAKPVSGNLSIERRVVADCQNEKQVGTFAVVP